MASDHSATIVDGKLARTSPSALKTFKRCGLKWYHAKVLKTTPKARSSKGADLGKAEHDALEKYLKTGVDTRLRFAKSPGGQEMIAPYLPLMPFNGGPALVEGDLTAPDLVTPGGVAVTGRYDIYIPAHNGNDPVIIDHKFKADVKWFDTLSQLATDEQSVIYGAWAMQREPKAGAYEFRHHNHQTKGYAFVEPRSVKVTRMEVLERFGAIAKTIDTDMTGCLTTSLDDVPYNKHACFDFGGCEYAHACHRHPGNSGLTALTKAIDNMGFRLKESEAEVSVLPPDAAPRDVLPEVKLAPPQESPAEAPAAPPEKKKKKSEPTPPPEVKVPTILFIDCQPVSRGFINGQELALKVAEDLAKRLSLADIRLAGPDSPLGYGKWKPALVLGIKENMYEGNVVVYTGSDYAEAVIEAYTPIASLIVRGG